jgi:hypothetical protein
MQIETPLHFHSLYEEVNIMIFIFFFRKYILIIG